MVMDGIYTGIPKKVHRPVADGIVCGLPKDLKPSIKADTMKVHPSATTFSAGVFGAGATPQGEGDGGKMKMAHKSGGMVARKKKVVAAEQHQELHNM